MHIQINTDSNIEGDNAPFYILRGHVPILEMARAQRGFLRRIGVEDMENLIAEGFAFIQLGRATIRDPDFISRVTSGEITQSDCDHHNPPHHPMSADGVTCVSAERGLLLGVIG